jgi:hypothetical protein
MLYTFEVTLSQNRTDTVQIRAESLIQVLDFYQSFSTAKITKIKKVVYFSKDEGNYISDNYDHELKTIFSTEYKSKIFSLRFPKKNLLNERIIKVLKRDLLHLNKKIKHIRNIVIFKN